MYEACHAVFITMLGKKRYKWFKFPTLINLNTKNRLTQQFFNMNFKFLKSRKCFIFGLKKIDPSVSTKDIYKTHVKTKTISG